MICWRSVLVRRVLAALLITFAAVAPGRAQSDEDTFGLPEGKGRDVVMGWCGACHSLNLVSQQRLPRWRWEELLVVMREKHGMPELDPADKAAILDYLAERLGPPPRRRQF